MRLALSEWAPDQHPSSGPTSPVAENVIPANFGYWSMPAPAPTGSGPLAYDGIANKLWYDVSSTREVFTFLGTDEKLYRLQSSSLTDLSRIVGGAYTTTANGAVPWSKAAFGNEIFVANGIDELQNYTLGGGGNFNNVDTAPNNAGGLKNLTGRYLAVIRDQLVMGHVHDGTNTYAQRVWWSALNDPTDFDPDPATQADYQDIPDLGEVRGITGGDYGVVLMERGIVRMDYVGPPTYFKFDVLKVSDGIGCDYPQSVIKAKAGTFYHAQHGWFLFDGQQLLPIGDNKIDRWWRSDKRTGDELRMTAAALPDLHCVGWLYVSNNAPLYQNLHPREGERIPDRILLYNIDEGRWSVANITGEVLGSGSSDTSVTLEDLDALYPAGLDSIPISLDSDAFKGTAGALGGMWRQPDAPNLNRGEFYTFEGDSMDAIVDTLETQFAPPYRATLTRAIPLVEGSANTVQLRAITRVKYTPGTENLSPMYKESKDGSFRMRSEGRFHRVRMYVSGNWQRMHGVDAEFAKKGMR